MKLVNKHSFDPRIDQVVSLAKDEGFYCGICYVLGYLNGTGNCGGTMYEEISTGAGEEGVIAYAKEHKEMQFTGLYKYLRGKKKYAY